MDIVLSQNLIIGAGPSGLAIAGRLRHRGIPFDIIEGSDQVAHSWHRHYDRLHLHTVKQWSHLPHLPFPEDFPLYVPRQRLVDYLEDYARHFDIRPRLHQEVQVIDRIDEAWQVTTQDTAYRAERVIIATGVNRTPKQPSWPGLESYRGKVVHSRYYKNAEPYVGKNVLVVGMGNTGAELALDLSEHQVHTYLSVRSPISVVPRDLNGRPVQVTSKVLAKFPFGLGDWLGSQIRRVYFGDLRPYGLQVSDMAPAKQLRETGKTPIVDIGTIDAIKRGTITVKPDIKGFDEHEVRFSDGSSEQIDAVILATGYTADVASYFPMVQDFLDENGVPRDAIGEGDLTGAYFIGYDNYKLGGILGTIQDDSMRIADNIAS